jgi:hypothetical protein
MNIKHATIIIGAMLVPYAIGSFTAWDINPGNWAREGRFYISFISAIAGVATYFALRDQS